LDRRGGAWQGEARRGQAGGARNVVEGIGEALRGEAWRGKVGKVGKAGKAW
jgi:hypothetical protein